MKIFIFLQTTFLLILKLAFQQSPQVSLHNSALFPWPHLFFFLIFWHFLAIKISVHPQKPQVSLQFIPTFVSFSSCQRNLTKTFQIEGMITLITKMTLIFSSDLLNGQKQQSKKAKIFRNFRNKSRSILMLQKISKNKKCAPKLIFFNKNFFQKISDDF